MENKHIIKPESFVKSNKQKLINYNMNESNITNNENIKKVYNIQSSNNIKNKHIKESMIEHQEYILDILLELRNYDEINGTELFNNVSYTNLNTFIMKNNF